MQEVQINGIIEDKLSVTLSGDIDLGNADDFYSTVMEAYNQTPASVTFACENLNFIDSTTLGTFVKILKTLKTDGFSMRLSGLQPKIKKLFVICALDSIIQID